MSDGTVWGLALWKLYETKHRDGRLVSCIRLNLFRRCCRRLLGAQPLGSPSAAGLPGVQLVTHE
jgi:hypothetical protein